MSQSKLKAAILIVSDTAFNDPTTDRAGSILEDVFAGEGSELWHVMYSIIIPDSVKAIQDYLGLLCDNEDDYMNLVVTTGGTGFAVKDYTPEAVKPMLDREAPGLVHGMLASSLEVTPFAMMSRPVAGVRKKSLVITLPGSPKGAKENLQAILKLLPHACVQAAGGDSRTLHSGGVTKLEQEAGVGSATASRSSHHHNHGGHAHSHSHGGHGGPVHRTGPEERPVSNDPNAGPANRPRESQYPKFSMEDATRIVLENTPAPKPVKVRVDGNIVGFVLAEDVSAGEAVPAFRASIVDGYAVIIPEGETSKKGTYPVASVSHAAPGDTSRIEPGTIARITTGAPIPHEATAVVMRENTDVVRKSDDEKEEKLVEILTDRVKPNENVREPGSDIKYGDTILKKGEEISAVGGEVGLLASVGKAEVKVYEKPIVGVMSTGNEVVQHDRPGELRLGEVRDCNRPTIMAAVQGWGFQVVDLGVAKDTQGDLEQSLHDAMRKVSVIITTGGVSMGDLDLLKPTIERSLGGTIHFGRVAMKPGLPTTFATVPFKNNAGDAETRLIFSLPGNPASAVVTSHLFVLPSLHHAAGISPPGLPQITVTLSHDMRPDPTRAEYHRATVNCARDGVMYAASTGGQRSSRVGSLKAANALLCLPAVDKVLERGEKVEALVMGRIHGL